MLIQSADCAVRYLVQATAPEAHGGCVLRAGQNTLGTWSCVDMVAPSIWFRKHLYLHIKK